MNRSDESGIPLRLATMPVKSLRTLNVFIGCPGDMGPERAALLSLRDHLDELGCPVRFLIWKNATPSAGNAQRVIFDNYPITEWDIFIGLLWTRFGIPSGIIDPLSGEMLTGTEAEFVGAYDAFLASTEDRPQILLYRCARDLPINVDIDQLVGVRKFFKQTETGAQRPALTQDFKTVEDLKQRVTQDLVKVAERLRRAPMKLLTPEKGVRPKKNEPDWAEAEESYRHHLCDVHRIVKFHTAEARAPVEVELEKVFIKLVASAATELPDLREWVATEPLQIGRGSHPDVFAKRLRSLPRKARRAFIAGLEAGQQTGSGLIASLKLRNADIGFGMSERAVATVLTSLPDLLRQQNHLALAGSPGSGKSTLLQYLALTFASRQQETRLKLYEDRLPVLIQLRQFHRWVEERRHAKTLSELKPSHFHEFLAHQWAQETGAPHLPVGFFSRLLRGNRVLILLDGLDEIAEPTQRRAVAALVATALDDWREARVILTSRPKAWESEGRAALCSRVGEARICDLDDAQIEEFVRHWYLAATVAARGDNPTARGHAASRAVDLIGAVKPDRIRRLAATPLMLSILAMVHSRGVGLPQERSQLYHECIEFMLGYWDEIAGFSPDPELHEVAARDR
ncbi:MAG: NACHT domain-containing NTPase, partial [Chthoniobacter sp.]